MDRREFEQLVVEVLDGLPADIRRILDNVQVTVAERPSATQLRDAGLRPGQLLFGLYQGIPQTRRTGRVPAPCLWPSQRKLVLRRRLSHVYRR